MLCFPLIYPQDALGFCFVSGVPATPEATEQLANRIAFIRETHCEMALTHPTLSSPLTTS